MNEKEPTTTKKHQSAVRIWLKILFMSVLVGIFTVFLLKELQTIFPTITGFDKHISQHWPYFLLWRCSLYLTAGYLLWKLPPIKRKGLINVGIALIIFIEGNAYLQLLRG